jgi:hypothetical protein
MKNFMNALSKTVASVYTAHTYSFAIRGYRKTVAPLYFADTYGFAIRGHCVNRSFGFQTTGMQSIPEHRIKRGVAL